MSRDQLCLLINSLEDGVAAYANDDMVTALG